MRLHHAQALCLTGINKNPMRAKSPEIRRCTR